MSGLFEIEAIIYDGEKYTVGAGGEIPEGFMDPNSVTWKAISKTDDSLDSLIPDFGDNKIVLRIPSTNDKGEPLKEVARSAFAGGKIPFPVGLVFPDSVEKINTSAFDDNQLTSVSFGSGLRVIGGWAFDKNQLTEIHLPEGLVEIEYYAFRNNKLTSVHIPDSVQVIGTSAFDNNPITTVSIGPNTEYSRGVFPNGAIITVREEEVGGD